MVILYRKAVRILKRNDFMKVVHCLILDLHYIHNHFAHTQHIYRNIFIGLQNQVK